jgi:type II secretory pathway predicted ATPase ExeA/septal ring-binding cell division protein DamX
MTEIQKHPNTMQVSPFQEEIAVENFYAGANRGEVLHRMTAALEEGVALMVLSGEEGSGKTMLCRMLESQTSGAYITVLFSRTVESFEDVVKIVAKRMGVGLEGGNDGKSVDGLLDRITSRLMQESSTLLIIFDEAENIYLATLERIRKMLDRLTHAGARISIVFAGRRTFLENCDQLSICDFKNTADLHFVLAPLTEQETGDYLRDCALRLENPDRKKVFNDEITRNIFSLAKGNFRVTNLLAEESLRTHGDDTSFMVLLESVKEEVKAEEDDGQQEMPHLIKRYAHYFPWIGGVGCIALLLFFLVKPDSGDRNSAVEQAAVQKESAVEEKATEVGKPPEEETAETTVTDPPPAASPEPLPAGSETVQELLSDGSAAAEKITVSEPEKPVDKGPTVIETVAQTSGSGVQPLPPPVKARIQPPPPVKIPVLRQDQPLKRKPQSDTAKGGKGPVRMQPRTEAKAAIAANTQLTVDQLLQKRLAAGAALVKRGMESAYTMQLMVLTDKNAEDNLKKMLAQPQYRKEAGNFFIYKRTGRSDIIFVFYGEYPDLAAARLAQDNLPVFLRVHQPYAISVKGALAKVKK